MKNENYTCDDVSVSSHDDYNIVSIKQGEDLIETSTENLSDICINWLTINKPDVLNDGMSTKIVILGKPGEPISGKDIRLEVGGCFVGGETVINIEANINEPATATIKILLPEIEYREK